ncbi:MAG: T9SS type A sorting domain-containing protein [Bacteroidales bacterium]|nr:T9SS type A sorting domain-containing protein [Bacteroidales bacterium]MCF8456053.1 T9SS type A sorting domain-containing protein [Bacteroidales bacterium]
MKYLFIYSCFFVFPFFIQAQIQFQEHPIIEKTVDEIRDVVPVDLDQDDYLDLLVASENDNRISWFKNDGQGNFVTHNIISSQAYGVISVFAIDIDGDGDNDVLSATQDDDIISWYENLGNGLFGSQQVISYLVDEPKSVFATDLDGDGDNDVLSASLFDNKIAWYENNGLGNFGPQQIITTNATWAFCVFTIDLDNDNDNDVISTSILDNKIAWYENLGSGIFGGQQIITTQVQVPNSIYSTDLDGDGDNDILSTSDYDHKVAWYENLGSGVFSNQQIISNQFFKPWDIIACDLDADGDQDVVFATWYTFQGTYWCENDGIGGFSAPIKIDSTLLSMTVSCADLDLDGDIDITAAYQGTLAWYPNDSTGLFTQRNIITFDINGPKCLLNIDLDGDNFNDILVGSLSSLVWFRNSGTGQFLFEDTISVDVYDVTDVFASDLDGDGANDVISSSGDFKLAWYANDGLGHFGPQQIISDSAIAAKCVFIADLDSDGDNDVICGVTNITSSNNDKKLSWWKNDGLGNFGSEIVLYQGIDGVSDVFVADLDQDGDLDILTAAYEVEWYENLGGANLFAFHFIGQGLQAHEIHAADLDGDNDLDVVASSGNGGSYNIHWWENNGSGSFTQKPQIASNMPYTSAIYANDMDKDGDIDIIGQGGTWSNSLIWFANDGMGNFGQNMLIADSADVYSILASDLDYDGDCDVLYNSVSKDKILWSENLGYFTADADSACANLPFIFGSQLLNSPGTYYDTMQTVFGLDSVVELAFSHIPIPSVSIVPFAQNELCFQESSIALPLASPADGYYAGPGVVPPDLNISQAGVGTHEISYLFTDTATGCFNSDSTEITIYPIPVVSIVPFPQNELCFQVSSIALPAASPAGGYYAGPGVVPPDLNISQAGVGTHEISYLFTDTATGCFNSDSTELTINPLPLVSISTFQPSEICYDEASIALPLAIPAGGYYSGPGVMPPDLNISQAGVGTHEISYLFTDTATGCSNSDSTELIINALPVVSISPFPQDTFCIQTGIIDFPLASPLGGYFVGAGVTASNINLNLADTGTHDISYQYTDTSTGCANGDTTQLIVIFCLSVAEEESLGISVYPNPANSFINIGFKNIPPSGTVTCLLFNSTGKEIIVDKATEFPYQIDISQLKAGLYYLKVVVGEKAVRYKIVKQ